MKTKITKGQWNINEDHSKSTVLSETGFPIAETSYTAYGNFKRSVDEIKANAKLIAAAPELLWALVAIVDSLENNINPDDLPLYNEIQDAKRAIKKATE